MSIKAMTWAMEQTIVQAPSARHVLLCLANYAGEDGKNAFPGIPTLVKDTGMSERGVRKILRQLEDEGAIVPGNQEIVNAYISRADRRPMNYDLQVHLVEREEQSAAREEATGGTEELNGGNQSAERGERGAPKPSYKPSKDPSCPSDGVEGRKRKLKTGIPPECPSDEDRQKAIAYWTDKGRNDLSRDVGTIADQFRAYHESHGSKMVDWSAAWRTWYCNQVTFRRPPPGHAAPPAPTVPDDWAKWERPVKAYLTRGIWNEMLGRAPGVARCPVPDALIKRAIKEIGWKNVHAEVKALLADPALPPSARGR